MDVALLFLVLAAACLCGIVAASLSSHPAKDAMFGLGFYLGPLGILIAVNAGIGHQLHRHQATDVNPNPSLKEN